MNQIVKSKYVNITIDSDANNKEIKFNNRTTRIRVYKEFVDKFGTSEAERMIDYVFDNHNKILRSFALDLTINGDNYLEIYNTGNRVPTDPVLTEEAFINKLSIMDVVLDEDDENNFTADEEFNAWVTLYITTQDMIGSGVVSQQLLKNGDLMWVNS